MRFAWGLWCRGWEDCVLCVPGRPAGVSKVPWVGTKYSWAEVLERYPHRHAAGEQGSRGGGWAGEGCPSQSFPAGCSSTGAMYYVPCTIILVEMHSRGATGASPVLWSPGPCPHMRCRCVENRGDLGGAGRTNPATRYAGRTQ